jgi:RHS repeat-associated protein
MNNIFTRQILLMILITFVAIKGYSQSQWYGPYIGLDSYIYGSFNFTARDSIVLKPGFEFYAESGIDFTAKIDENLEYTDYEPMPDMSQGIDKTLAVGSPAMGINVSPSGGLLVNLLINVPKGIAGMEPQLSVCHNSQGSFSLMGYGCDLSGLSVIARVSSNKFSNNLIDPVDYDANDQFMLDGSRLVFKADISLTEKEYRTENESFSRILYEIGTNTDYFIVETKGGKTYYYGNEPNSRIEGAQSGKGLFWHLTRVTDEYGNAIVYNYINANNLILIKSIEYTLNTAKGISSMHSVKFFYGGAINITDWPTNKYYAGVNIPFNPKLLSKIVIYSSGKYYREYNFQYCSPDNKISYLATITEKNENGKPLNPVRFRWEDYIIKNNQSDGYYEIQNKNINQCAYDHCQKKFYQAFDVNNDGITDIFSTVDCKSATDYTYLTDEKLKVTLMGGTKQTIEWDAPAGYKNAIIADFDGDGIAEILYHKGSRVKNPNIYTPKYSLSGGAAINGDNGDFFMEKYNPASGSFVTYQTNYANYNIDKRGISGDHDLLLGDFNGDHIMDMLLSTSSGAYRMYIGNTNGSAFWFSNDTQYSLSNNGSYYVGDYDGDGKSDLFLLNSSGLYVSFYDNNTLTASALISSTITNSSSAPPLTFGDINGDGLVDVNNLVSKGYIQNNTGFAETWGSGGEIACDFDGDGITEKSFITRHENYFLLQPNRTPEQRLYLQYPDNSGNRFDIPPSSVHKVTLLQYVPGDFDGNGIMDHLINYAIDFTDWDRNEVTQWITEVTYAYQIAGPKKLVSIKDGYNRLSQIRYTMDYACDPYEDDALNASVSVLKTPVYLVESIIGENGNGTGNTVSYSYKNLRFHKYGKGFLGFREFKKFDKTANTLTTVTTELDPDFVSPSAITTTDETPDVGSISSQTQAFLVKDLTLDPAKRHYYHYPSATSSTDNLNGVTNTTTLSYDDNQLGLHGNPYRVYTDYGGIATKQVDYEYEPFNSGKFYRLQKVTETLHRSDDSKTETVYAYKAGKSASVETQTTKHYRDVLAHSDVITTFGYDDYGNINSEAVEYPDYTYSSGNLTQIRTTRTKGYTYADSKKGRFMTGKSEALDFNTPYDYDNNNLVSVTSPDGLTTRYEYDKFGNLIKTTNPDNTISTKTIAWYTGSNITGASYSLVTSSTGSLAVTTYFNKLGQEIRRETIDFKGRRVVTETRYRNDGKKDWQTQPYFNGTTPVKTYFTYDSYGRPYEQYVDAQEQKVTYAYSEKKITTTLPGGRSSEKEMDATGKLYISKDAIGNSVTYSAYNGMGLPKTINTAGITVTINYDEYGNQVSLNDPSAGLNTYTYNAIGQLIQQDDPRPDKGKITTQYDALGRITQQYTGTSPSSTYVYDTRYKGKLTSVSQSDGTSVEYWYDNLGRVTSEKETVSGNEFITGCQYNSSGDIWKITYPSGLVVENIYDASGNLTEVKQSGGPSIWKATDGNALGQVTESLLGNGRTITKEYSKYGETTRIYTPGVMDYNYGYFNDTRNMSWRRDNSLTENFTYDNLDRLKSWGTGQPSNSINYNNITISDKSDAGVYSYDSDKPHRISALNGSNMPEEKVFENINYNDFNKISHIDNGNETNCYSMDFIYNDAQERRKVLLKKGSTELLSRYYIGGIYEKEIQGSDERELNYISGGDGLAAVYVKHGGTDTIYYIHTDHLGSWVAVSNNLNSIIIRQSFDPWGRKRNPDDWTFTNVPTNFPFARGFTGHEHMNEFDLINMNGRVYDPILGVFISPDNFAQEPANSQNFNRYTYCLNNPLMYKDPDGNFFFVAAIIGFVANYAISGISTGEWGWRSVKQGFIGAASAMIGFGVGYAATAASTSIGFGTSAATLIGSVSGGAASGVFNSSIAGGNVGQGILTGMLGGFIGGAINLESTNMNFLEKGLTSMYTGAWSGGFVAGITGGDIMQGMRNGAIGAGVGFLASWGYNYIQKSNAERAYAEQRLGMGDKEIQNMKNYGNGRIVTCDEYDPDQEIWNDLRDHHSNYGDPIDFLKTRDYDNDAILKFGRMHVRYGTAGMTLSQTHPNAYLLQTNHLNVHYDKFDVVVAPVLHLIFDTFYQGHLGVH